MILPFIDQANLYNQFSPQIQAGTQALAWTGRDTIIPALMCPSDPANPKVSNKGQGFFGNYVLSAGSQDMKTVATGENLNGMFYAISNVRIRDVTDGTSMTVMGGELVLVPDDASSLIGTCFAGAYDYRGGYYNALSAGVLFVTLNPPNTSVADQIWNACGSTTRAPCSGCANSSALVHSRSYHEGGAHILLGDGAVRFISENIDRTTFQRLGSRADGNPVGEF